jgi:putative hydrolase of the HAD superfamily
MHDCIQAVFFDAVGTLVFPQPPAPAVYALIGRKFGSRLTEDAIAARFRAAWAREEALDQAAGYRTSEEREVRRWRAIVSSVLDDVADGEACFMQLYLHFARPEAWACAPGAGTMLTRLAQQGIGLGMASNYDHRLRGVVAGIPALSLLKRLVISAEVGWRKPAVEFFTAMTAAAAVPRGKLLYVGDDPENDYRGAQAAEIHPILFDTAGRSAGRGYHRITRLEEVLSLLVSSDQG